MADKRVVLTEEGLKKLEEKLEYLKSVRRLEVADRLKAAIALGDLSENSEYDDAKNEQAFIEGEILTLESQIRNSEIIKADEALERGLITKVVSATELDSSVFDFAQNLILSNSAQSMQLTKQLIADVQGKTLTEGLDMAATLNAKARATDDCKKGIAAFLNKEKLSW